ncbi:MAG: hypothetical protein M0Z66_08640 [Thermaerobacter sp.]|nr:hypothetical protein [Thermaerobacter sp.]
MPGETKEYQTPSPELSVEGLNVVNAVFASLTPHMVARFGEVAESATTALDYLVSPELLSLLRRTQEVAPLLEQGLSVLAALGAAIDIESAAPRVEAAARAARKEAEQSSRSVGLFALRRLQKDPGMQYALRFLLSFAANLRQNA